MKSKLCVGLSVLAACLSVSGYGAMRGSGAYAKGYGWVAGANIGYGYLSTQEEDIVPPVPNTVPASTEVQSQSTKIGSVIGGVYLGMNFPVSERTLLGWELGYKYLGRSEYNSFVEDPAFSVFVSNDIKVTQQAVDFLLTGRFYVWNCLSFIGKAGAAYVRSQTKDTSNFSVVSISGGLSTNETIWRLKPEYSLGLGYSLNNNLDLDLMYTHIGGVDTNVTGLFRYYNQLPDELPAVFEYNGLSLGLTYTFC